MRTDSDREGVGMLIVPLSRWYGVLDILLPLPFVCECSSVSGGEGGVSCIGRPNSFCAGD